MYNGYEMLALKHVFLFIYSVAAKLHFCSLLHIDWFKTHKNIMPSLFDLPTVCVHTKQLHFKAN